jgi:hypothetical protein
MSREPRPLIMLMLACALALRMWVPAGWMPAPGAHNFAIMPCPATEPTPMADMGQRATGHQQDHSKAAGDCFAPLLAGAALPESPVVPPRPLAAPAITHVAVARTSFIRPSPALPPPSTGPPALA